MDILLGSMGVLGVLAFAWIFNYKIGTARQKKLTAAINNAIIDLYEDGYITPAGMGKNPRVKLAKGKSHVGALHTEILKLGFPKNTKNLTAKNFHDNLYKSLPVLRQLARDAGDTVDTISTPKMRIAGQSNADVVALIPLVIFGDLEAIRGPENPSYEGDTTYAGAAAFGTHSHDDNSGGHDGGGGDSSGGSGGDGGGGGGGE